MGFSGAVSKSSTTGLKKIRKVLILCALSIKLMSRKAKAMTWKSYLKTIIILVGMFILKRIRRTTLDREGTTSTVKHT